MSPKVPSVPVLRELVSAVTSWWTGQDAGELLAQQVHIQKVGSAFGERSVVSIDHLIPANPTSPEGIRVTTQVQRIFLPSSHFDADVRKRLKEASRERGRAIYCIDRAIDEVVAAISYHLDEDRRRPVLITAIGLRIDDPQLFGTSRAMGWLLTQYVQEIARQCGRGAFVDLDAAKSDSEQELRDLGFRPAPRVRGFRVSGRLWRQGSTAQ